MKLAISPAAPGMTAPQLVDLCVRAEGLGYRDCWIAEVAGPEAFALAGAIAQATSEMDLGVAVVAASNRSPALHAMGAATVSQLLGGRRFGLGIGSSSELIVEQWHGREFTPPLARVREAVEGARVALEGGREYLGRTATMRRFTLATPPLGRVPIFVGALGPKMLRLAGAVGDGVCLNLMPPEVVVRQRAEIARGASDAGRDLPDGFEVMARLHTYVVDDLAAGRDVIRRAFGPYFAQPVYNRFLAWCGFPDEAAAIERGFATGDRAAVSAAMHDALVDGVALVGPAGRVRDRLDEYDAGGIDIAALNIMAPDGEALRRAIADLAP